MLGAAIGRHAWVNDEGIGEPCGPDHLATVAHRMAGGAGDLWFGFDLIPGRGLGFSGAARAAAAVLAKVQQGLDLDAARHAAYPVVVELEGHGDNAAPSVFGGVQLVAGDEPRRLPVALPGHLLLWVPPHIETSTDGSRQELPSTVSRSDAVFNLGRVALLVAALYEGDAAALRAATEDRLHQPHRLDRCAPASKAMDAALSAGAAAAWLSGSGPSVAMIVADDAMADVRANLPADGDLVGAELDTDGAVLVEASTTPTG